MMKTGHVTYSIFGTVYFNFQVYLIKMHWSVILHLLLCMIRCYCPRLKRYSEVFYLIVSWSVCISFRFSNLNLTKTYLVWNPVNSTYMWTAGVFLALLFSGHCSPRTTSTRERWFTTLNKFPWIFRHTLRVHRALSSSHLGITSIKSHVNQGTLTEKSRIPSEKEIRRFDPKRKACNLVIAVGSDKARGTEYSLRALLKFWFNI